MKALHFLYHELRPEPSRYSYVVQSVEFARHCELFSRLQRDPPTGHLRPEVTFDDGNQSDLVYALPILAQYGIRAHFFITAGWTSKRPGFMSWSDLRELSAAGHTIGAHGWTHKLLTRCSDAELDQELRQARLELEDGLGTPVTTMSLPGGRSNASVLRRCEQAGYRQVFTSEPKSEEMSGEPKTVGRLNLVSGTQLDWLERVLQPGTGQLSRLHRAHQVKAAAKALLGDKLYASVWGVLNRQEQEPADAGSYTA